MIKKEPSHSPQTINFSSQGKNLTGYFYVPAGTGPFPCIVDNHGSQLPKGSADLSHPQTAAFFQALGYAYLFPHRAGYGESEGIPLYEEVSAQRGTSSHDDQLSERLERENQDVIAALDWLQDKDSIDSTRIAVMGSSLGGIHALLALSRDKRWKCGLDFSGGASQWRDHTKIRNILQQAAADLTKPVFLIQPENDFNTAPTKELAKILSLHDIPHRATIFPAWGVAGGEAHRFCANGQQIWGPEAKDFLEEFL